MLGRPLIYSVVFLALSTTVSIAQERTATADGLGVNWQTSDSRYNAILNRIENHPGSCLTRDEAAYIQLATDLDPDISDVVSQHWIRSTRMCPTERPSFASG